MTEALLLDFDGVLVDSEQAHFESWAETYRSHGHSLHRRAWQATLTSGTAIDWAATLERLLGSPLATEVHQARRAHRARLCIARPGLLDLVRWAQEHRVPVAVVSNAPSAWVVPTLRGAGYRPDDFTVIITADDGLPSKPDPAPYVEAVLRLSVSVARSVAVEDTPIGVSSAKAAGLYCVALPNRMTESLTFHSADLVVRSPLDLLPLLKRGALGDNR